MRPRRQARSFTFIAAIGAIAVGSALATRAVVSPAIAMPERLPAPTLIEINAGLVALGKPAVDRLPWDPAAETGENTMSEPEVPVRQ